MEEVSQKQILLIAPSLLSESLVTQLSKQETGIQIILKSQLLTKHPSLIIWALESIEMPYRTTQELAKLSRKWQSIPILLLLPEKLQLSSSQLLDFECEGLLQDPDMTTLTETIKTLLNGGRVIKLKDSIVGKSINKVSGFNFGRSLSNNGIELINQEINNLDGLLSKNSNMLISTLAKGRIRELSCAKTFLIWLWGPSFQLDDSLKISTNKKDNSYKYNDYVTNIVLPTKDPLAVSNEIIARLNKTINAETINKTGDIFAFEALKPVILVKLQKALIQQLKELLMELKTKDLSIEENIDKWNLLQVNLRKEALREMSGNYAQLNYFGNLVTIYDQLNKDVIADDEDDETPSPYEMINTLVLNHPLNVDGQLLPSDHPKSLIKLELLLDNWLIRTSEIICSELVNISSAWTDLRQFLLKPSLISTRELERLRNQLNSQNRIENIFKRPIKLYESKRKFYRINNGSLESILITEPRDQELRELAWLQRQVTLLVEARDALAPQVQAIIKYLGDLMVVLLTNVLGRAIGLIGKGIAQGMGRTLSR